MMLPIMISDLWWWWWPDDPSILLIKKPNMVVFFSVPSHACCCHSAKPRSCCIASNFSSSLDETCVNAVHEKECCCPSFVSLELICVLHIYAHFIPNCKLFWLVLFFSRQGQAPFPFIKINGNAKDHVYTEDDKYMPHTGRTTNHSELSQKPVLACIYSFCYVSRF